MMYTALRLTLGWAIRLGLRYTDSPAEGGDLWYDLMP